MKTDKWKVDKISLEKIVPASLNANEMSEQDFKRLCDNIGISGLSSVPTCYHRASDDKYVIISGHHRVRAAEQKGYREIYIMFAEEEDLTRDEIIAIQLSHNSLHGEDNKGILKRLFDEIHDIDFKYFAHVDINEIGNMKIDSFNIVPFKETYTLSLVLYKNDLDLIEEVMGEVAEKVGTSDVVIIADQKDTENEFLELRTMLKQKYDIQSSDIALAKIFELAKKQIENENLHTD